MGLWLAASPASFRLPSSSLRAAARHLTGLPDTPWRLGVRTLYAAATRDLQWTRTTPGVLAGAVATSAVDCVVDYRVVLKRLAFGVGLAAGAYARATAGKEV
jgi:hypothetical protein